MLLTRLDNKFDGIEDSSGATGRAPRHLERDACPERQRRVCGRGSRPRPGEFISEGEPIFPDRPRPANGDAGSKAVCGVVLRNAIDVCIAAIVVARADSCIPSLAYIVTVKGREDSQRILREMIVSLERIIGCKETPRGVQVDPRQALIRGD